ncbi:MAG: hypothetical protein M1815_005051 [Lichina confinis]|nr:MAG: hypothetical protein M1815_005051 [Lichina confinis]
MLRRKPTAITLTSEDVAAYEDRQTSAIPTDGAGSLSQTSHGHGLDSSQVLGEIEAARQQQHQQQLLLQHGLHRGTSAAAGADLAGPGAPAEDAAAPGDRPPAPSDRTRPTRATRDERIGVSGPAANRR